MRNDTKWKLYMREGLTDCSWWFVLPVIEIRGWDFRYCSPNFSIEFHVFCFHYRLMFMKEQK